jgi:hypothetical protein
MHLLNILDFDHKHLIGCDMEKIEGSRHHVTRSMTPLALCQYAAFGLLERLSKNNEDDCDLG